MSERKAGLEKGLDEIPEFVKEAIKKEVREQVDIIRQTLDFYEKGLAEHKERVYLFLEQIRQDYEPALVLYPASGSDKMAKRVFGEDRVIHTSIEDYGEDKGEKYFEELGEGEKVVADNIDLPFPSSQFQVITIMGVSYESIEKQREEFVRVLEEGGIIAIVRSKESDYDEEKAAQWEGFAKGLPLKSLPVPHQLEGGEFETKFMIFQKVGSRDKE